ncbi:MAG: sigma-70 family RNA polymerase sigma factor [Lentimicrobiaceae bacterium]
MRNVVQLITGNKSDKERELVQGCTRNNRIAQRDLYYKYCDAMFTIAYRIVNNRDDAHDALQDAFIQVFRDIAQFRFDSTLGAWIKTIVVRTSLKLLSKNRNLAFANMDEVKSDETILIPDTLKSEYLEKVILSLPDGYRTVFLLVEVEGYTHEETANMLGISAGTSKSQLHHAKKMLKNRLSALMD